MDITKNVTEEALRQLLEQARLPEDEVTSRLKKALSPAYWEELNPSLSVGRDVAPDAVETTAIDSQRQNELLNKFNQQGYFQIEPLLSESLVKSMRECVALLKREGWPPVFAFIYDQFWLVWRIPSLVRLLSAILGPGYQQTFQVWSHYIPARSGAAGWPPHLDGYQEPDRLTVWIPLSDATLDNGCIYLIPKHFFPSKIVETKNTNWSDLEVLLQGSRALPAKAGSILCWDYGVMHWGSICDRPAHPRVSIAVTLVGKQVATLRKLRTGKPTIDGHANLPNFAQRLEAIGTSIQTYCTRELLMMRYQKLAERLLQQLGKE